MKRTEPLEIPEAALREIIYNALIHRLYTGTFVQMKVYNDRVSVWNEGTLPEGFPVEMLMQEHSSRQRNPLIANVFFLAGFVETWGRGIKKIRKALQGVGLPDPVFDENCGGVRVTIQRPRNIANLVTVGGGNFGDDFGDDFSIENQRLSILDRQMKLDFGDDFGDEKQVYAVIFASPEISQPQIAAITKISARSVSRIISRLKDYGYLRRQGSDRKGSWVCLK
jgi:ATP-dependent DNA helicase RecG